MTSDQGAAEAPAELSQEELKRRGEISKRMAAALGEVVSVLMQSPRFNRLPLADLAWLVMPPLAAGQFVIADAQQKSVGFTVPVGVVLWATVSAEVDQRLSAFEQPMRLKPEDWKSGDILWIMIAEGDQRVLSGLVQRLRQSVLKGRPIKVRAQGADGKLQVQVLEPPTAE